MVWYAMRTLPVSLIMGFALQRCAHEIRQERRLYVEQEHLLVTGEETNEEMETRSTVLDQRNDRRSVIGERAAGRQAGRAGHHRGAGRKGNVERTSPKHKTGIQDFPQPQDLALVRWVIWRLHAVRSDDWIVDWILSLGVDEGICLVNCLNANRFACDAVPSGGVLLSRCLTAASR
jgi:hypothetical protein